MFDRPIDAVRYALALHPVLEAISQEKGVTLAARVGIHMGEVVLVPVKDGTKPLEAEGITRVVCARLMSLAEGGQTLISRGAFDLAKRASVGTDIAASGVRWQSHGRYVLKGVDFEGESDPIEVCEVGYMGMAPFRQPQDTEKAARVRDSKESAVLQIPVPAIGGVVSHRRMRPVVKIAITVLVLLGIGSTALLLMLPGEQEGRAGADPFARNSAGSAPAGLPVAAVEALARGDFSAALAAAQAAGLPDEALATLREAAKLELSASARPGVIAELETGLQELETGQAWRRLLALKLIGAPGADGRLEAFREAHPDAVDSVREEAWKAAGRLAGTD
jgi:hypothetical protein